MVILLVDDDPTTNFLHRRLLRKVDPSFVIEERLNGEAGTNFLEQRLQAGESAPGVILVDLKMPVLDGWGFLDKYVQLPSDWRSDTRLYIVSTSLNPDDQQRAQGYPAVTGMLDKMSSTQQLRDLFQFQN